MKRILFRMSVLGTVITLGLIAIAHAQRGSEGVASADPAASGNVPLNGQIPESNPLRSQASRQTADFRNTALQTGAAGSVATPTPAPERFSLAAATDTGMAPPPTGSAPTLATPVAPDFGPPEFFPAAGGPINSVPTNGSFASSSSTMLPLDTGSVASGPLPAGSYLTDADPIPQQLDVPEAQPMNRALAAPTYANLPVQPGLSGPQMAMGKGRPGVKDLEGAQAPQLLVEKVAPGEIQVGRPAIFEIRVQNVGTVAAKDVEIRDEIPQGTRLQSTKPQASQGAEGGLVWKLGTLNPNQDVTVEMELMPTEEGEIGSVARVYFQAEASVRTKATRPLLAIETEAVDKVLKGEELTLKIKVSNPGTGIAENVVLEEHVPPGFRHPAGAELEYEVGNLAPNESRELTLILEAVHPGPLVNVITARGEPSLRTEHQRPVEVIASQLEVAVQGPTRRFLECEAVYNFSVRNPGTAPAKQVELAVEVPAGMKFVSGTNRAYYQEATRTVHWMLEEIPVQDGPPPVQLTLMPVEAGEHKIRLVSSDDSGAKAEVEQAVHVEGIVAMYFEVADLQDPIEVGGQTLYEIRVVNQGSKEATNVRLAAEIPAGLRAIAAEGPTQQAQAAQSNIVLFQPLPRLAAKADVTYRIRVEGVQPGDLRIRVQVATDEIETPITKEESTRVYSAQ
jgi:uncharacterized repeat protein (TIGR01451 family)